MQSHAHTWTFWDRVINLLASPNLRLEISVSKNLTYFTKSFGEEAAQFKQSQITPEYTDVPTHLLPCLFIWRRALQCSKANGELRKGKERPLGHTSPHLPHLPRPLLPHGDCSSLGSKRESAPLCRTSRKWSTQTSPDYQVLQKHEGKWRKNTQIVISVWLQVILRTHVNTPRHSCMESPGLFLPLPGISHV